MIFQKKNQKTFLNNFIYDVNQIKNLKNVLMLHSSDSKVERSFSMLKDMIRIKNFKLENIEMFFFIWYNKF